MKPPLIFFVLALSAAVAPTAQAIVIPLEQMPREALAGAAAKPADLAYDEGLQALNRKNWSAARAAFSRSLQLDPRHHDALLGLAHLAAQQDKLKEAEDWLKKALASNPQNASGHLSWGRFLVATRRPAEAETALKQAAALAPKAAAPHLALGDLYSGALNKPQPAIEAYRQAARLNPEHAGAHYGLGMGLLAAGQLSEAESTLKRSGTLSPGNPLPQLGLGRVYVAQGRHAEAIALFDAILATHANQLAALVGRGDAHFSQQNFKAATADYQRATRAAPKHAEAHLKLGMSLQAQQKTSEAEKAYRAALQIEPQLALAYNNLAAMAPQNRTPAKQTVAWAEKAVQLAPDTAAFLDTLGWAYYQAGMLDKARTTLERALARDARAADTHYRLGAVLTALNRKLEAKTALRKALAIQPQHPEAKAALAKLK